MAGRFTRRLAAIGRRAHVRWKRFRKYGFLSDNEARGQVLLREWLSPGQLAQYDEHGYFDVTGCQSGKRYRIREGVGMNVYELDAFGGALGGWCFVPKDNLVAGDVMLAQKIALETSEQIALLVARRFPARWTRHP